MHRKFVILGLVLLFVGSTALGWILLEEWRQQQRNISYELDYDSEAVEFLEQYNEWLLVSPEEPNKLPFGLEGYGKNKTEAQLRLEQKNRLQADLDTLAAGEINISPFADVLYGEDWRNEVNRYKKRRELSEFILTGSIVCISMGGTIFGWYLLFWLSRFLMRELSTLRKFLTSVLGSRRKTCDEELIETDDQKDEKEQEQTTKQRKSKLEKHLKAFQNSSKKNNPKPDDRGEALSAENESRSDNQGSKRAKKPLVASSSDETKKIAVLLSDEKSVDSLEKLENSLKVQTEKLEERTAQSVQQAIIEHSKPLDSTLKDLAQQVSAIREYASCQQERVEKLQDGYDWNIIRTFCLRVIRCIDNLDNRISQLSSKGTHTEHLEEIKDELVFALESSGIEQYEPEVNSEYRGQEKFAEAVKDKQPSDKPKQKGKIAEVIRPGYQYFINEENIKVIRTAQVRLFG